MHMFSRYDSAENTYTPNNMTCVFPVGKSYTKLDPIEASKPYEEYDTKGNLIGYSWAEGQTVNLEFNIDGVITVEDTAIILNASGEVPLPDQGALLRRAYNIVDMRSWTCTAIVDGTYMWSEDSEFTYDDGASRAVYISAENYLRNKQIELKIYNFRKTPIYTQVFSGSSRIVFTPDKFARDVLKRGVYTCSLTVLGEDLVLPIFTDRDCVLLIK